MDPVSILTLVTFCVTSSASLYDILSGSKSRKKDVQNLKSEVGALNIVMQALAKNIEESTENFEVLRLILDQCNQACKDFEEAVLHVVSNSESRLQEIKNWAKLQYLGDDINNFRKLISSYKVTVTIALVDSNLRTSRATRQLLEEYTEMSREATSDLEEQVAHLSAKLELLQSEKSPPSTNGFENESRTESAIAKQALDQKASLEQCLNVCHQLLDHIEDAKMSILEDAAAMTGKTGGDDATMRADRLAPRLTADALKMCVYNIDTAAHHLQDLRIGTSLGKSSDEFRIVQQLDSARQCLSVIEKAQEHRVNVFEDIDTAEDSVLTAVSNMGTLIRAKGLTVGARSLSLLGQMNDETMQKLAGNLRPAASERSSPTESHNTFEERHGFGQTMNRRKQ